MAYLHAGPGRGGGRRMAGRGARRKRRRREVEARNGGHLCAGRAEACGGSRVEARGHRACLMGGRAVGRARRGFVWRAVACMEGPCARHERHEAESAADSARSSLLALAELSCLHARTALVAAPSAAPPCCWAAAWRIRPADAAPDLLVADSPAARAVSRTAPSADRATRWPRPRSIAASAPSLLLLVLLARWRAGAGVGGVCASAGRRVEV
jgi:hypothetical protein